MSFFLGLLLGALLVRGFRVLTNPTKYVGGLPSKYPNNLVSNYKHFCSVEGCHEKATFGFRCDRHQKSP